MKTTTKPSEGLWRTMVRLTRLPDGEDGTAIWASVPGFAPRIMILLTITDDPDAVQYPTIPSSVAERIDFGTDLRCHVQLNIGAERWEDLLWPTDPKDWEI